MHTLAWLEAMRLQHDRVMDAADPARRQIDAHLYVLATRLFLLGIELLKSQAPPAARSRIEASVVAFDAEVPHAVKMRNRLTHFDEYVLRQPGTETSKERPPMVAVYEHDDEEYSVMLLLEGGAVSVPVVASLRAAERLYEKFTTR